MTRSIFQRLFLVGFGAALGLVGGELLVRGLGLGEKGSVGVLYEADARLGWRHRRNLEFTHETAEYSVAWRLNGDGLRRDREVDLAPNRARWLVLGDSYAAGHGVGGGDTFASRLEVLLPRDRGPVDVLNLGVDGYSTSQELLGLDPAIARYAPEAVILGVYPANDVQENENPLGLGGFPRPLLDDAFHVRSPPELPPAASTAARGTLGRVKDALAASSKLYVFVGDRIRGGRLHHLLARIGLMRPPYDDMRRRVVEHCHGCHGQLLWGIAALTSRPREMVAAVARTAAMVERMAALCRERGIRFVALLIPSRIEVEGDSTKVDEAAAWMGMKEKPRDAVTRLHGALAAALDEHGVPVVDVLAAARARKANDPATPLYFAEDWHLNPAGHAFVADELLAWVAEHGWVGP